MGNLCLTTKGTHCRGLAANELRGLTRHMGRGRAKAKQTRVARDLKYRPIDTDFDALERELRGKDVESGEVPDQYADYADYGHDDSDDESRRIG